MKTFDLMKGAGPLIGLSATEALLFFERPTIIRIPGQDDKNAILISVLLHGCEPAGFKAFLKEINSDPQYPMDVYFLVGNVDSAKIQPYFTNRLVPRGENYNRIWVNREPKSQGERIADGIFTYLKSLPIIAHLDLHSFTAKETHPHAMVMDLKGAKLASKFVKDCFLFGTSIGAIIEKTSEFGPSCIIECGTNNSKEADDFAYNTMQKFFVEFGLKEGRNQVVGTVLYDNTTIIKINPDVKMSYDEIDQDNELTMRPDVGSLNITELPAGEFMGWADSLNVFNVKIDGKEVKPDKVFRLEKGKIFTRFAVVPNLMAANVNIAKESGFYFFQKSKLTL